MPTFSLSPVVTMFSTMDNSEDTLTTASEHLSDNQHAQHRAFVFNMDKRHPETLKKAAPSVTTHPTTAAIAPHLQSFDDQTAQKHRVSDNNSQLGGSPVKRHQFDGAALPFQSSSTASSPSESTHSPKVSLPATSCKSTNYSASIQDSLLVDTVKSKSRMPGTMGSPKTARRDETPITVQNFPITVKNFSITRDRLSTCNTHPQDDLMTNRCELSQSTDSSPSRKTTTDFKGKGKERYIEHDADKTADIFEPVGSASTYIFGPGQPRFSSSSQDSDKTITPSDFIRGDPNKTPTLPIRAGDVLRQLTISDSNIGGPSSQDVVSRLGSTTYSAVPDDEQDWPHTSGLNYDERCAVLKGHVEAMEDRKRAQELMNAENDCADVVLFTKHHLKGIQEVRYHREVILKDSGYMARIMPLPNDDGSPVSMFMGTWPIAMIRKDDLFYHMSPAWVNYHCFLLACAFECNRQQGYNARNLRKIVESAEKQTRGSYATYQLAYWEFSQCEEALRDLVRIAFKEKGHQEAQRPMRVLVARLVAVMVPWILRGKYMGPIMVPLWFEMKEEYLPWREMLWHYIATGEVQSPDWAWLGTPMSELQITTALSRFGAGF
ncbi:hypothetical protein F5X68DRAFT_252589 [Plectosphaerella plurivora]|uniref:Uncharacterized protein n=1 Tax=Plectosphaerella plurivora TaxID=936078 RepID=A0A9P8VH47_9PEZI|nr:hypothetical protein F5X68DRAFT_252589 [Plectosphaerella plurivora]